jgi:hypothetical protein
VDLEPTNLVAMGVPVSGRSRVVDFRYSQGGFWTGSAISGVAVLLIALLAHPRARPRRRRSRSA